jgi:hypothetical protein
MGKEMEQEKNIIKMVNYYLKENIQKEKEMEKEKNIMIIVI